MQFKKLINNSFVILSLFTLVVNQTAICFAGPIAIDGSTNTSIGNAENNIPVVNIARPTNNGLSKNNFEKFNVESQGVIINNSNKVDTSILGGALYANPNFTNSEASIILNQVTSNNKSSLNGFTEIFGKQAEYILANPNGITCKGCGFINTNKLTLATGVINFDSNDNISTIDISDNAKFVVSGLGLDASDSDYFDIVTRTAEINASIWAGESLNIRTGRGEFDFDKKEYTNTDSDGSVTFSIDASALGSLYAGKILLQATEDGVGVKSNATMVSSSSDIIIEADGEIRYKDVYAKDDISITSYNSTITNKDGYSLAEDNLSLKAKSIENDNSNIVADQVKLVANDIDNNGSVVGKNTLSISSKNIFNYIGGILSGNQLNIDVSNGITNNGIIEGITQNKSAVHKVIASFIENNGIIQNNSNINYIVSDYITNTNKIISQEDLRISTNLLNNIDNNNSDLGITTINGDIEINSNEVNNINGKILSGNKIKFIADNIINDENSYIGAFKNIDTKETNFINNKGVIETGNDFNSNSEINNSGYIISYNDINIDSSTIDNDGIISSQNKIDLILSGNIHNSGLISAGKLNIDSEATLNNSGTIESSDNSEEIENSINAINLTNTGTIQSTSNLTFNIEEALENKFYIISQNNLTIKAAKLSNKDNKEVTIDDQVESYGIASIDGDIKVIADEVFNKNAKISSGNNVDIESNDIDNNDSIIIANENISLKSDKVNNDGEIIAGNEINLDTNRNDFTNNGIISANNVNIITGAFGNKGSIFSKTSTTIDAIGSYVNTEESSDIISEGLLSFILTESFKNDYLLESGSISVEANEIENNSKIKSTNSNGSIKLTSKNTILNNQNAEIISNGNIITKSNLLTNSGQIIANDFILIEANEINNNNLLFASNHIYFDTTNLTNNINAEIIAFSGDIAIGKNLDESGNFTEASNIIKNYGGKIAAGNNIIIDANELDNNSIINVSTHTSGSPAEYSSSGWNIVNFQLEDILAVAEISSDNNFVFNGNIIKNSAGTISAENNIETNSSLDNTQNTLVVNYDRTITVHVGNHCSKGGCSPIYENRYETKQAEFSGLKAVVAAGNTFINNGEQLSNIGNTNILDIENHSVANGEIDTTKYLYEFIESSLVNVNNDSNDATGNNFNDSINQINKTYELANFDFSDLDENNSPSYDAAETKYSDIKQYQSSEHFLDHIGFSSEEEINIIGDQYIENQIIRKAIVNETGRFYLSSKYSSFEDQIYDLYQNAENSMNDLDLSVGIKLSKEQINQLKSDIIWLVAENVDGKEILVPKLYLSKATTQDISDQSSNGAIISANNILIDSDSITNSGNLIANSNILIESSGDYNSEGNSLISAENSYIKANNVNLEGSNLRASGNLSLDIENNLNLLSKSSFYQTAFSSRTTQEGSSLAVDGDLLINTGNDVNIFGSSLTSSNNVLINTGNDFNIASVAESSYEKRIFTSKGTFSKKSSTYETWNITQKESHLASEGDLEITSNKDINIAASKINANNLSLVAGNEINLTTKENFTKTSSVHKKSGLFSSSLSLNETRSIRQVQSEANSNDEILTTSGGDTNLIAAKLNSGGNTTIIAGKSKNENGEIVFNKDAKVNISNAMDSDYSYSYNQKTKMDLGAVAVGAVVGGPVGLLVGAQAKRGNINEKETYDETIVSGSINSGNNLIIKSASDLNIISSNVQSANNTTLTSGKLSDANGNEVIINNDSNINIASAKEKHFSREENTKIRPNYAAVALGSLAASSLGNFGEGALAVPLLNTSTQKKSSSSNISSNERIVQSNINSGNDYNSHSLNNTNIISSNINSNNNTSITANNEVNLVSGTNTSTTSNSSSRTRFLASESASRVTKKIKNISSNINTGNSLDIKSGSNTNIISSNLNVGINKNDNSDNDFGNATITTGKYVNSEGKEVYNENAKLNISAAKDIEQSVSSSSKKTIKINDLDKIAKSGMMYGVAGALISAKKTEISESQSYNKKETNSASNLNIANNLKTISASNTNIISSNVVAGNNIQMSAGNISVNGENKVNNNANVNILSTKDTSISNVKNKKMVIAANAESDGDIEFARYNRKNVSSYNEENISSNIVANNNIDIDSKNDVNILASNVISDSNVNISSGRKVNVLSSTNNSTYSDDETSGKLFLDFKLNENEISATAAARMDKVDSEKKQSRESSSNVFAKNVNVSSGDDINIKASNISANENIDLKSSKGDVNILSQTEKTENKTDSLGLELGVKVGITHNIGKTLDAVKASSDVDLKNQVGIGQSEAIINIANSILDGDSIDEMLEGNEKVINDTSKMLNKVNTGGSAGIMLHGQAEINKSSSSNQTSIASSLSSGNNINISSNEKDVKINGSIIDSGKDININAGNNIDISASTDTQNSKSKGGSLSVDIAIVGGGFNVGGEIHASKSESKTHNNSEISAKNNISLKSNNDSSIKGANIKAENDLDIEVGGNLELETKQNTAQEKSFSLGGGYGQGSSGDSYSANISQSKSSKNWSDDQTKLIGGNSVNINVEKETKITGAMIANQKPDGSDGGNLTLNTGTLITSDLSDFDKSRSISLGGSYSDGNSGVNSGSGNIGYSMHDKEQITKATIGNGSVNISENEENLEKVNRDIQNSQEMTKNLEVSPIDVSASFSNAPKEKFNLKNYIKDKLDVKKQVKSSIQNKIQPFEDNFKDISNDLKGINNDLIRKSDSGTADKVENKINNIGDNYWSAKDKAYDAVSAASEAVKDNLTLKGKESSVKGLYNENRNITESIKNFQKDENETNKTFGLTNLNPESVEDNLQKISDNHSEYNASAFNGDVSLFQDDSTEVPMAYAVNGNNGDNILINTQKTDLTNSGDVVNKVYHEGFNSEKHSENERSAVRYGNYAEDQWNGIAKRNNYQNSNLITNADWNSQYNSQNSQSLAKGSVLHKNSYTADNKNVNNYFDPANMAEALSLSIGSKSLYDNVKKRDFSNAAVDAGGILFDLVGLALPVPMGYAGASIKAKRSGDNLLNVVKNEISTKSIKSPQAIKQDIPLVGLNNQAKKVGYHVTSPEAAESILKEGFREGNGLNRLGKGVYVNDSLEGALAEFNYYNKTNPNQSKIVKPVGIQTEYVTGYTAISNTIPRGKKTSIPLNVDSISSESVRLPGSLNTNILDKSNVKPLKMIKITD